MQLDKLYILPSGDIHCLAFSIGVAIPSIGKKVNIPLKIVGAFYGADEFKDITKDCELKIENERIAEIVNNEIVPFSFGKTSITATYKTKDIFGKEKKVTAISRIWVHQITEPTGSFFKIGNGVALVNDKADNFLITMYCRITNKETLSFLQADGFHDLGETSSEEETLIPKFPTKQIKYTVDITGHPYCTYKVADSTIASVSVDGRITGRKEGKTKVEVFDDFFVPNKKVGFIEVIVLPAVDAPREIVNPIHIGKNSNKKKILFLAEGFKKEADFQQLVQFIVEEMKTNPLHQPFGLLKDDLDIYTAFEPSLENGITIGPKISEIKKDENAEIHYAPGPFNFEFEYSEEEIKAREDLSEAAKIDYHVLSFESYLSLKIFVLMIGLDETNLYKNLSRKDQLEGVLELIRRSQFSVGASYFESQKLDIESLVGTLSKFDKRIITPQLIDNWITQAKYFIKPRISRYGFQIGRRLAEQRNYDSVSIWPIELANAKPKNDDRRTSSKEYFNVSFDKYLGSLKLKDKNHKEYDIGKSWQKEGDSRGLVVILVNEEFGRPFNRFGHYMLVFVGVNSIFGNKPSEIKEDVLKVEPHTADYLKLEIHKIVAAAVTVHELGHSLNLIDEYEERSGRPSGDQTLIINLGANILLEQNIQDYLKQNPSPDELRASNWLQWARIEEGALLLKIESESNNQLKIEVSQTPKPWKVGDKIHIRTRNINGGNNELFNRLAKKEAEAYLQQTQIHALIHPYREALITISAIAANSITVNKFSNWESFQSGSFLYTPMKDETGQIKYLVKEEDLFNMFDREGGIFTPFYRKNDSTIVESGPLTTPNADFIELGKISNPQSLIGIYEGGGIFSTGTYRPTGKCKMRSQTHHPGIDHKINHEPLLRKYSEIYHQPDFWHSDVMDRRNPTFATHLKKNLLIPIEFCHVCQYNIVNLVSPSKLSELDKNYPK